MTQTGACAECGGPIRFAPGIGWAHTGTEPPRGEPHHARYLTAHDDCHLYGDTHTEADHDQAPELTPCIACGAPISDGGAGHDDGCPVMVTDTTIAADMARAAIDNRETWAQGGGAGGSQLRSRINGAPLYIMARATVAAGQPIYAADDAAPED